MFYQDMKWDEMYNIGVEEIDLAHQEFFRILGRLKDLSHNRSKHEWIANQGIKFLKQYAIRHFDSEELYMRSIGYIALPSHKYQHEVMKTRVIPRLEAQLRHDRFSPESIEKFLQIMRLWLGRHILGHDKAIGWASMLAKD